MRTLTLTYTRTGGALSERVEVVDLDLDGPDADQGVAVLRRILDDQPCTPAPATARDTAPPRAAPESTHVPCVGCGREVLAQGSLKVRCEQCQERRSSAPRKRSVSKQEKVERAAEIARSVPAGSPVGQAVADALGCHVVTAWNYVREARTQGLLEAVHATSDRPRFDPDEARVRAAEAL